MMKKQFVPFDTAPGVGSKPITQAQADLLFTKEQLALGVARGRIKTFGPWQLPLSYTAIATAQCWEGSDFPKDTLKVFGPRTISRPTQSGHELIGQISVEGERYRYRAFTSSTLFELPDGRLINAATIHVCGYFKK